MARGSKWSGCREDCGNCPYPDCVKPAYKMKSDGYDYAFMKDGIPRPVSDLKPVLEKKKRKMHVRDKRPIRCVETGDVYQSLVSVQAATGINKTCICNALRGRSTMAGGYHWEYVTSTATE